MFDMTEWNREKRADQLDFAILQDASQDHRVCLGDVMLCLPFTAAAIVGVLRNTGERHCVTSLFASPLRDLKRQTVLDQVQLPGLAVW